MSHRVGGLVLRGTKVEMPEGEAKVYVEKGLLRELVEYAPVKETKPAAPKEAKAAKPKAKK